MATQKQLAEERFKNLPVRGSRPWTWRRAWLRSRNGYRRTRRAARWSQTRARRMTDYVGAEYICKLCGNRVLFRQADEHNLRHAAAGDMKPKVLTAAERANEQQRKQIEAETHRLAQRPAPRQPSRARAAVNGAPPPPGKGTITARPPDPDGPSNTRQAWNQPIENVERDMAGRTRKTNQTDTASNGTGTPGLPASGPAAAMVKAVQAWCETECSTVADLKTHLLGGDAAFGAMSDLFHQYAAQQIVARKIHPAVAQPIDGLADSLAGIRHYLTEAYVRFEHIYADRLAYERSQDKPKPAETLFSDVG